MDSQKIFNKDLYNIKQKFQFPTRTTVLESTEKIYNKIVTYIIENNKESIKRINKRSINHQVKETDRIRKTTRTLEKRATRIFFL